MKQDPYWFFKKWGFPDPTPSDIIHQKLEQLEEKYNGLLSDVKRLEEENVETTNTLYELMNSLDAIDTRIDILTAEKWIDGDV